MTYSPVIKICGLSTFDSIDAAIEGGASHLGFMFFEKSPRHIADFLHADALSAHVSGRAKIVAVTVDASDEYLAKIVAAMKPDYLQLHGQEKTQTIADIRAKFGVQIIKALSVAQATDLQKIDDYNDMVDLFLLDAKPPKDAKLPGGNGVAFDWTLLDALPKDLPYLLAGGLTLENIEQALRQIRPHGIDLSSGVESAPGLKDTRLIHNFLQNVTHIVQDM